MQKLRFNDVKDTLQRLLNIDAITFNGVERDGSTVNRLLSLGYHVVDLNNSCVNETEVNVEGFGRCLWNDCADTFEVDSRLQLFIERVPDALKALVADTSDLEERARVNAYCQAYKAAIRLEVRQFDLRYRPSFAEYSAGYTQTPKESLVFIACAVFISSDPASIDWKQKKEWLKKGIRTKTANPQFNSFIQRVRRLTRRGGALSTETIEGVALAMALSKLVKDYTQARELLRVAAQGDEKELDDACASYAWYNKLDK